MRLTLSLSDYLHEGLETISSGKAGCPVCYEQVLTSKDVLDTLEHILRCYFLLEFEIQTEFILNPSKVRRDEALDIIDTKITSRDYELLLPELIQSLL
jgi:hypothetical protein